MVAFRASAVHLKRLEGPYTHRKKIKFPWEKLRLFSLQGRKLDQPIYPTENQGHPQGTISRDLKVDTHSFYWKASPERLRDSGQDPQLLKLRLELACEVQARSPPRSTITLENLEDLSLRPDDSLDFPQTDP